MDHSQEQFLKMQQTLNHGILSGVCPQDYYMSELEYRKDLERMKELYPNSAKQVQGIVEDECDQLEYAGSFMFDEYPDRLLLNRLCDRIYQRATGNMQATQHMPAPDPMRPPGSPDRPLPPPPPSERNDGLTDLIKVLLFHEMYQRRCRYHRCTGW